MRPLIMNLGIEPALHLFEVSTMILLPQSKLAAHRVLKVLAQTPAGAVKIVRARYPKSRAHQIVSKSDWDQITNSVPEHDAAV